jgi:hypothetical protein
MEVRKEWNSVKLCLGKQLQIKLVYLNFIISGHKGAMISGAALLVTQIDLTSLV